MGGRIDGEIYATRNIFAYETDSKEWTMRNEQIVDGRHEHVAFLVPDEYCQE